MIVVNRIKKIIRRYRDYERYKACLDEYIKQCGDNLQFSYNVEDAWPIIDEYNQQAGMVDGHYFFQDIYVAKLAHSLGCKHVYDIGSRIDGYISHLLCLDINVTMIDIRPLDASVEGLDFLQGNATDLSSVDDESIEFLSSLHALEHFGLGRYGDPVDYIAWKKALKQMQKKIKVGGRLCLSVPIGNLEKLAFNAQRIFLPNTIVEEFDENILVERFAYIHEGRIVEFKFNIGDDYNRYFNNIKNDIGECDCGIFLFRKID